MKKNDDEQITINHLIDLMKQKLADTTHEAYGNTHMKNKLEEHFGERIVLTEINGHCDYLQDSSQRGASGGRNCFKEGSWSESGFYWTSHHASRYIGLGPCWHRCITIPNRPSWVLLHAHNSEVQRFERNILLYHFKNHSLLLLNIYCVSSDTTARPTAVP